MADYSSGRVSAMGARCVVNTETLNKSRALCDFKETDFIYYRNGKVVTGRKYVLPNNEHF